MIINFKTLLKVACAQGGINIYRHAFKEFDVYDIYDTGLYNVCRLLLLKDEPKDGGRVQLHLLMDHRNLACGIFVGGF